MSDIVIFDPKTDIMKPSSWAQWAEEFVNIKRHILQKEKSVVSVESSMRVFERFMGCRDINVQSYGEFYQFMVRGHSKHYSKKVLIVVNAFLRYCEDSKYLDRSPHWNFPIPSPGPSTDNRIITHYQYTRMLREANGTELKPVFILLWWCGFSLIDAVKLRKESVDMEKLIITSARSKTSTVAKIPFVAGSELYHMLQHAMKGESEYINPGAADSWERNEQWLKTRINRIISKHAPGRTSKHFRNTFASRLHHSGVPEKMAMKIGGWKSADIFKGYIIEDVDAMREQYDKAMKFQPKPND